MFPTNNSNHRRPFMLKLKGTATDKHRASVNLIISHSGHTRGLCTLLADAHAGGGDEQRIKTQ
jgi:hypothetical protein